MSIDLVRNSISGSKKIINIADINHMVFAKMTKSYSYYMFQMQERYLFDMMHLKKHCSKENYEYNLKYIIFVVLYILDILNSEKIVHNDLHSANILLKSKKEVYPIETEITYTVNHHQVKFDLTKIEYIPFIADWEMSVSYRHAISTYLANYNTIDSSGSEVRSIPNTFSPVYDIIVFLNNIAYKYKYCGNGLDINLDFMPGKIYGWLDDMLNYIYSDVDGDTICDKIVNANKFEYIDSYDNKLAIGCCYMVNCRLLDDKFKDKTAMNVLMKFIDGGSISHPQ
jgi:serine/threonine protein kinase